jgi:uncharacterized membrane protein
MRAKAEILTQGPPGPGSNVSRMIPRPKSEYSENTRETDSARPRRESRAPHFFYSDAESRLGGSSGVQEFGAIPIIEYLES